MNGLKYDVSPKKFFNNIGQGLNRPSVQMIFVNVVHFVQIVQKLETTLLPKSSKSQFVTIMFRDHYCHNDGRLFFFFLDDKRNLC